MKASVAIPFVADELEGDELVFDPEATRKGIVQSEYDRYRKLAGKPLQTVGNITEAEAYTIYDGNYWRPLKCSQMPNGVDLVMFQMAVNIGIGRAVKILQNVLGINQDGIIGPKTLAAINGRNSTVLVDKLLDAQDAYYDAITKANPARNRPFINGWHNRVQKVKLFLTSGLTETGIASIGLVAFVAFFALLLWAIK